MNYIPKHRLCKGVIKDSDKFDELITFDGKDVFDGNKIIVSFVDDAADVDNLVFKDVVYQIHSVVNQHFFLYRV